jgi:hypothetical protein
VVSTISDPHQLTTQQQQLIVAAMENRGRLQISVRSDTHGRAVRSKEVRFFDPDDRAVAAGYVEALKQLERLLFVRQSGSRESYELTNFGWLIGRKLQQEQP